MYDLFLAAPFSHKPPFPFSKTTGNLPKFRLFSFLDMQMNAVLCLQAAFGRTTVMIAHRLSSLRDATHIIVIDEGKVAEIGQFLAVISF